MKKRWYEQPIVVKYDWTDTQRQVVNGEEGKQYYPERHYWKTHEEQQAACEELRHG